MDFWAFAIAALVAAAATPLAIRIAPKIGAMDIPKDGRRMHDHPIPRFGGIAIFLGLLVSVLLRVPKSMQLTGVLIGAACVFVLGVMDDIRGLRPRVKLLGQLVCAAIPCFFSVRITGVSNFLQAGKNPGAMIVFPLWLQVLLTVIWIVGITNTVNLIDGLDGLAAGISAIACFSVAYTAYLTGRSETSAFALAISGAAFGFLLFNFYPAKIFMGDAGSMLLGFMLATCSLISDAPTKRTALTAAIIPALILAVPVFDTLFAILRRALNHKPIMQADKGHIHHRIMAMGFGQRRTVMALYCISAIAGVAGILWTNHYILCAGILTAVALMLMIIFLGVGEIVKGAQGFVRSSYLRPGEKLGEDERLADDCETGAKQESDRGGPGESAETAETAAVPQREEKSVGEGTEGPV